MKINKMVITSKGYSIAKCFIGFINSPSYPILNDGNNIINNINAKQSNSSPFHISTFINIILFTYLNNISPHNY